MLAAAVFLGAAGAAAPAQDAAPPDPRTFYDVRDYRLDVWVDPENGRIRGLAALTATVEVETLEELVLDAERRLAIHGASWVEGPLFEDPWQQSAALEFQRGIDQLTVRLPRALARGELVSVAVQYSGQPVRKDDFSGFHVSRTPGGDPWIATSCQTVGAHTWWPCKASFFHPEDKNERMAVNVTVPRELYAASNGRLVEVEDAGDYRTYRWRHDYPQPTYSVALSIAPYTVIEHLLQLPGQDEPVPVVYYVLPEDRDKAELQFEVVPELLEFFAGKFGPYPFPGSKFALAQSPVWGMEHSTLIAYGNSFPAYLAQHGGRDPFEERNRWYDYILVHEAAHEWWGNAVSARSWGDFWIHEGFATYSEALWVEHRFGQQAYFEFMAQSKRNIQPHLSVYRPHHRDAGEAYDNIVYDKGAHVLHMLRYLLGDEAFFAAVKEFATDPRFLYGEAGTDDFREICEKHHGASLWEFFQPWLYGTGWPRYLVSPPKLEGKMATLDVDCRSDALFDFVMPLEIELTCEDGSRLRVRHTVRTGTNKIVVEAPSTITRVEYPGFQWILCDLQFLP